MERRASARDGLGLCAISGVALVLVNTLIIGRDFPMIGHDNRYYVPRLLDTDLHLRLNGLWIQWYTPSFGGGLPGFPNPQHLQHSILQLFTFWVNPWIAILLAIAVYTLTGFYGFYRFLRGRLALGTQPAVLGAVFLIANGFFLEHMIVGHVGFQMFPLIAILLLAITDRRRRLVACASVVALVLALMVYQAGIYLIILLALSLALTLPLLMLLDGRLVEPMRAIAIGGLGGGLAGLIASPKIAAVLAFMNHFPREMSDVYDVGFLQGLAGFGAQLVGAMVLLPAIALAGRQPDEIAGGYTWITGAGEQIGMWEIDTGLSPVLLICLIAAATQVLLSRDARAPWRLDRRQQVALAATLAIAWVLVEATLARGLIYPWLKTLPILKSLHVNPRVASTFILPLSILGAVWVNRRQTTAGRRVLTLAGIVVAIVSPAAYLLLPGKVQQRTFDVGPSIEFARAIRGGARPPVTAIIWKEDSEALIAGGSSYRPYEPLFGYGLETFAGDARPGPVRDVRDGHFNMTHPASLVYPEANGLRVFERIPTAQAGALEDFVARRQPRWIVPAHQTWLNVLALVTLAACVIALARGWRPQVAPRLTAERARG